MPAGTTTDLYGMAALGISVANDPALIGAKLASQ